jgi:membrane-bound lytic murein transglycosylase D
VRKEKTMKIKLLMLVVLVWALPVTAAELPVHSTALMDLVGDSGEVATIAGRGASGARVASLAREAHLGRELEIPGAELTPVEEAATADADFDLRLPEAALPDADIPLTLNGKVEYFIRYFQNNGRNGFSRWLSRSERYIPMMKEVLKKEGLPEDLVFVAMIESGFSPHAYSVAAAVGPWQFMSATGKRYALRIDGWIDERRDPLKSTVAAALYLKELYGIFNKDWYLAAAGYNAGENKILRAIGMYNSSDFWEIAKGSYLKRETKDYVPKLLAAAIIAKEPARYGFADVAYLPPIEFDTIPIPVQTDLEQVARACGVSYDTIRDLNPELRRWATPPDYPGYELKVPKGKKELCEAEYAKIPEDRRYTEKIVHARYRARKKDTLASVASKFGTTPEVVAELNSLGKNAKVRGRVLVVPVKAASLDGASASRSSRGNRDAKAFNKYYTVKKGDTLPSLAKRFKIPERLLSAWNNLRGKVTLRAGKRIIVAKYVEKNGAMVSVAERS